MFTKSEEEVIYQIINMFQDEKFKESRIQIYNNKPDMLNPLEMYVIEEIYRLGYNNYFNKLMNLTTNKNIIQEYNNFMKKCREDFDFELNKVQSYYRKNNGLSDLEKFCISLILKNEEKKELLDKRLKYKYDDLFEIKYSTDEELKDTIANIIVSFGIHSILKIDNNEIKGIKDRQLEKGVFSDIDKKFFIDLLTSDPKNLEVSSRAIEGYYKTAKLLINDDNGEEVLNMLFGCDVENYRINITANEVFGKEKNKTK